MDLNNASALALGRLVPRVHPLAVVDPGARIGTDVEIGPFAVVDDDVEISDGCRIMAHAALISGVRLGRDCQVHQGAIIGGDPQNLAYDGARTFLHIGPRTIFREYVTVSRATQEGQATRIGADCMFMAGSHVGHDCVVGNKVVVANAVQLAGHCEVADGAVIGGGVNVHQFVRIGRLAMLGGGSSLRQDAPPFMITAGALPAVVYGLNLIGLKRNGISAEVRTDLKSACRLLYRSNLNVSRALDCIRAELPMSSELLELVNFIATSERGLCAGAQQRRRRDRQSRGGSGMEW